MFFTRTQKYQSQVPTEDFKSRLIGDHVKIHNMDFEVYERGQSLKIVPHAEQVEDLKTLPITDVQIRRDGKNTEVVITSKIRKLDYGGPQLIMLFCAFLLIASIALMMVGRERMEIYTLLSICTIVFGIFWVRMEMGYFDYVRKIRNYIKSRTELAA